MRLRINGNSDIATAEVELEFCDGILMKKKILVTIIKSKICYSIAEIVMFPEEWSFSHYEDDMIEIEPSTKHINLPPQFKNTSLLEKVILEEVLLVIHIHVRTPSGKYPFID